jgi:hypothetical protein
MKTPNEPNDSLLLLARDPSRKRHVAARKTIWLERASLACSSVQVQPSWKPPIETVVADGNDVVMNETNESNATNATNATRGAR